MGDARHLGPLLRSLGDVAPLADFYEAARLLSAVLAGWDKQQLLANLVAEAERAEEGGPPGAEGAIRRLWVLAAAASYALGAYEPAAASPLLDAAAARLYLPLLGCAATTRPPLPTHAVRQALAGAVSACGRWDLACAFVQAGAQDVEGRPAVGPAVGKEAWTSVLQRLPAHTRVQLAASMVEAALQADGVAVADTAGGTATPAVLALASREAFQSALCMLASCSQAPAVQQALARQLLPAALKAAERLQRLPGCLESLLDTCRALIASRPEEKRVGLALLVQFTPQLLVGLQPGEPPLLGEPCQWLQEVWEADGPQPLWQLFRECLLDLEPLNRKRAAHLLKAALGGGKDGPGGGRLPTPWDTFFKLFDTLEDFSLHLVQDTWPEIDKLHPPEAPAAAAPSSKQRGSSGGGSKAAAAAQQQPLTAALPFPWMRVLWLKGLAHPNLWVQRIALTTLLNRAWCGPDHPAAAAYLRSVPVEFLGRDLARALGLAHMHKPGGEAAAGARSGGAAAPAKQPPGSSGSGGGGGGGSDGGSWGPELSPVTVQATRLVRRYCSLAPPERQRELLLCLLRLLAEQTPSRLLLQSGLVMLGAVAETLAAAAAGQGPPGALAGGSISGRSGGDGSGGGSDNSSSGRGSSQAKEEEALRAGSWDAEAAGLLRDVSRTGMHFGTSRFVMSVYRGLIHVAACILRAGQPGELLQLGQWVADFQLALIQQEGPLHDALTGLVQTSSRGRMVAMFPSLLESYYSASASSAVPSSAAGVAAPAAAASPEELAAWRNHADAISRLALLATSATVAELDAGFGQLASTLAVLYRRPYLSRGAAEKSLVLLAALLEACTPVNQPRGPCGPSPLQLWLAQLLARCSEELCSYASMKSQALWAAAMPHNRGAAQVAAMVGDSLPQETAAAISLAQLAVSSLAGALELSGCGQLAQHAQQGQQAAAAQRYGEVLQQCLRDFAAGHARLPTFSSEASAEEGGLARAGQQAEQQAPVLPPALLGLSAAQLECLVACLHGLAAGPAVSQQLVAAQPAAAGLLPLLLPLHQAGRGTAAGRHSKAWWQAVSGLVELEGDAGCAGAPQVSGQVLALAIGGLAAAHRSCQIPMLRTIRFLLPLAVTQPEVLRGATATSADGSAGGSASLAVLLSWLYSSTWAACADGMKRRTGLTAAFVATCLHPVLFAIEDPQDPRLALHAAGGPVKQLVRKLLAAGQHSARIMALAALQLCGVWGRYPLPARLYYRDALQELCLYGLADEAAARGMGEVMTDPESAAELAAILRPTDPELAEAFATTPIAPRVAVLCLLHEWASAAAAEAAVAAAVGQGIQHSGSARSGSDKSGDSSAAMAAQAAQEMWAQLLQLAIADPDLGSNKYTLNGPTHRRKVRLWQALCVLSPALGAAQALEALDALVEALSATNAANIKQYQETVAVQLLQRDPSLFEGRVLPLLRDYNCKGDAPVSLVLVGARVLLCDRQAGGEGSPASPLHSAHSAHSAAPPPAVAVEYVRAVVGWTLSHVHATRTFSQLVLWRLLELWPSLPRSDPSLGAMLAFFTTNTDIRRLRAGLGKGLDSLHIGVGTTPRAVLGQGRWPVGPRGRGAGAGALEGAPVPLLDRIQEFLAEARAQLRESMAADQAQFAEAEMARGCTVPADTGGAGSQLSDAVQPAGALAVVQEWAGQAQQAQQAQQQRGEFRQRKITPLERSLMVEDPWAAALGLSTLTTGAQDEFEQVVAGAEAEAAAQRGRPRQDIIVVASLIDRVPNLAGLCRTCEVFRAGCLVLADASVARDPSFAGISVTAEQHIPIQEVSAAALLPWLRRQAGRGYCLVGLEQTAESTRLQDFAFPPKTVLVLGSEVQGIPANVLEVLHATVEIPQLGLVRSLNVHVSGAIALYEFTRQALGGGGGGAVVGAAAAR